ARLHPVAARPRSRQPDLYAQRSRREADHYRRNVNQRTIRMTLLPLLFAVVAEGDAELVEGLRKRDPQALGELYDRYGRLTYSLIYRIVRDTGIAEDLVQETFLRVWNRAQAFDAARGALGSWLLAVARNRAIDYTRSTAGRMRNALEL